MQLNEKTFSLAKHIQHEADRHGAYCAQPDGRVSYELPTQTLECIAEEHIVSMRTARAVASAIGIVIT